MVNEVGIGVRFDGDTVHFVANVRTSWANPDALVAKLAILDLKALFAGSGDAALRQLATDAQGTPLADDLRAGWGGMLIAMVPVGALSAAAIPAFLDYMKRSKRTEADMTLNMIAKHAKRVYADTGKFPVGKSATLPAGKSCCGASADNRCVPDPKPFAHDKLWAALDVSLDAPTMYQYRYEGTAKEFTATATGDVDCDGTFAVWTLHGTADAAGNVTSTLQQPAPGVY
jgi:type II secretory pathway pseudopilin PulG